MFIKKENNNQYIGYINKERIKLPNYIDETNINEVMRFMSDKIITNIRNHG